MSVCGLRRRSLMTLLVLQALKELVHQQKYLKREDIRNAKKSNQKLLKLLMLLEIESKKVEKNLN